MRRWANWSSIGLVTGFLAVAGCSHVPPTIAHTHIGHSITGFDGTPEEKGLFVIAESRGNEALEFATQAARENTSLAQKQTAVRQLLVATISEEYGLRLALSQADGHISFASKSEDASANVRRAGPEFSAQAQVVLQRCDLMALLANDVLGSSTLNEADLLTTQIYDLARANVHGDDAKQGTSSVGLTQLRTYLDAMVGRENPSYVPVDRWYLFHLVRLPDCDNCWAWHKWANSSNRGY
jgi:hypothetical protein